jgi:hypothetical protein
MMRTCWRVSSSGGCKSNTIRSHAPRDINATNGNTLVFYLYQTLDAIFWPRSALSLLYVPLLVCVYLVCYTGFRKLRSSIEMNREEHIYAGRLLIKLSIPNVTFDFSIQSYFVIIWSSRYVLKGKMKILATCQWYRPYLSINTTGRIHQISEVIVEVRNLVWTMLASWWDFGVAGERMRALISE